MSTHEDADSQTVTGQWMESSSVDGVLQEAVKLVISIDWLLNHACPPEPTEHTRYVDVVILHHGNRYEFTTEDFMSRLGITA